jgi:putative ABC transport system permease protein
MLRLPGYRRFGLRNLLMVAQVAGSLMLLLMTGFLVMGISKASRIETKFDPHSMHLLSLDPVRDGYAAEKAQALFEKLPERLKSAGPVRGVALASEPPFTSEVEPRQLSAEDAPGTSGELQPVLEESVGAGYFATLSEPMLAGREFVEADHTGNELSCSSRRRVIASRPASADSIVTPGARHIIARNSLALR